ncbi:MAG: esterase-like activity of phytase family protein [Halothece sp.]
MSDRLTKILKITLSCLLLTLLTACGGVSPQTMAQQRLFPELSLEFLGEYQLPKTQFKDTPVGGLSGITYDQQKGRLYAVSDDRSERAPARFYTLNLILNENTPTIETIDIENVTFLKNEQGQTYPQGTIDSEGIALSPRGTVFISSEGDMTQGILPFIKEYDLETGEVQQQLRIPDRFLPNTDPEQTEPQGIQNNLGFEHLTINNVGLGGATGDPFRLFTATESSLIQDGIPTTTQDEARIRFLHYVIGPIGSPLLVAEHLYLLDPSRSDTLNNGLTELLALPQEGNFLSLERTFGLTGFGAKLYEVAISNATDTSRVESLNGELGELQPLRKKLLLDLSTLGIELDNLEGMTLGPRLSDGRQTLIAISDDNFNNIQVNQFLLFALNQN